MDQNDEQKWIRLQRNIDAAMKVRREARLAYTELARALTNARTSEPADKDQAEALEIAQAILANRTF
jgi:hypothetical protein